MDPRTRLGLVLCVGTLAVTLEHPLALGVLCGVSLTGVALARVDPRWWRRGLVVVAALVWSTVLSQGLFYGEEPRIAVLDLGPLALYREGIAHGLAQSLRFVAVALAGLALSVSTPPDRMYAALLRLRVPFGLALMTVTALRLLPDIARDILLVRGARSQRGREVWRRSPWAWLSLEVSLLRPVVARCWRRAHNLAESLDARGFDPVAPRRLRRPLRFGALDGVVLVGAGALTAAAVFARLSFALYTSDTWYHPALRPVYALVRDWL